jgi:hypothetical protein
MISFLRIVVGSLRGFDSVWYWGSGLDFRVEGKFADEMGYGVTGVSELASRMLHIKLTPFSIFGEVREKKLNCCSFWSLYLVLQAYEDITEFVDQGYKAIS